jgi:hypothetical protein
MEAIERAEIAWRLASPRGALDRQARFDATLLVRWLAGVLIGALSICGVWLMVRRLTGSFAAPLDGGPLVAVGALAVTWAAAARLLWRYPARVANRAWRDRVIEWAPTVALVLIATAAVMPGTSLPGAVLLWTMIVVEEIGAALIARRKESRRVSAVAPESRFWGGSKPSNNANQAVELDDALPASELRQQQTRKRTADGNEAIDGTLQVVFANGQRIVIEHIAFCPMLARVPTVSAIILDELEGSVRATHVYRYGARLEVKLRVPCDEAVEVAVHYSARS